MVTIPLKYECKICKKTLTQKQFYYAHKCFPCQAAEMINLKGEEMGWKFVNVAMSQYNIPKEDIKDRLERFFK